MIGVNVKYTYVDFYWTLVAMRYILVALGSAQSLFYPGYIKLRGWGGVQHISQAPWRVLILIGSAKELNNIIRYEGLGEYQ